MPKWSYVTKYENPRYSMESKHSHSGPCQSSPCFFGKWASTMIYKIAYNDLQENLHSLIELDTCTCGLKVDSKRLMAIVESPNHRNHTTLEPDPNPQFRGLVGRRLHMPMQDLNKISAVDLKWDRIVRKRLRRKVSESLVSKSN